MKIFSVLVKLSRAFGLVVLFTSCRDSGDSLTLAQSSLVKDSVQQMVESIARDISNEGPTAWTHYFENSPDFFMASQGMLAFTNNDSMANFLMNVYVKRVSKIQLNWRKVRIDPFTTRIAGIAATFHEDVTDTSGLLSPTDGFFTGIAEQTAGGWRLRNAHWSIIPSK